MGVVISRTGYCAAIRRAISSLTTACLISPRAVIIGDKVDGVAKLVRHVAQPCCERFSTGDPDRVAEELLLRSDRRQAVGSGAALDEHLLVEVDGISEAVAALKLACGRKRSGNDIECAILKFFKGFVELGEWIENHCYVLFFSDLPEHLVVKSGGSILGKCVAQRRHLYCHGKGVARRTDVFADDS